jgi:protein-S-isoprenylcysteine O-methyltransferase Ste14
VTALLLFITACWIIFLAYWIASARRVKPVAERQSRWTTFGYRGPLILGCILLSLRWLPHPSSLPPTPQTLLACSIGAALCALGLFISIWSRRILGSNWSSDVLLRQGHQLIQTGPYRYARHPIYTGVLSMCLGTAIVMGGLNRLLGVAIIFAAFWIKLRQEETLMMRQFPADYPSYKTRVKALIPFVI